MPKTPIHDRLCKNCSDIWWVGCSKFNDLRRDYVTSCFNKNINRSNDISSKFVWLLSYEGKYVC